MSSAPPTVVETSKELPKKVEWGPYTTLTLGSVIAMLQEMQKTHGDNTPVMGVEFGLLSNLAGVESHQGCIVIK
jgi:hypothetical protein